MSIKCGGLLQSIILFVVFFQLPLPVHSQLGRGKNKYCRRKYTEPLILAVKMPDLEPSKSSTRKIFNSYKCVTRKMREELISPQEDSRVIRAATECCSEVYYKKVDSKKCKKLARRMKKCIDFALAITEDFITQGIFRSIGAQPLVGYGAHPHFFGGIHPMHPMMHPLSLYGGVHPMHTMMHPLYGGIHSMHAMMRPFYRGVHPMHTMVHPFYGGMNAMHAAMRPYYR
ncbi:hypothetical protein RF11_09066 [Thelohanellus kitauei]|uniref:Uncharacterized protein n=1 Tax=Thelohanellus kitauei TaxID=669202 RepID=A0A0C2MFC0_THEKT|nr:hypothetical protein RF11_09066 [Thelohanellus kitauei]